MKMFLSQKAVALLTLLSVVNVDRARAIRCYECNGVFDSYCNEPFDGIGISVVLDAAYCSKAETQYSGHYSVQRGAWYPPIREYIGDPTDSSSGRPPLSGCKSESLGGEVEVNTCYCSSDLCNGATPTPTTETPAAAQGLATTTRAAQGLATTTRAAQSLVVVLVSAVTFLAKLLSL